MLNLRQLGQTLNNNNNINILLSFHAHGFVLVGKRIIIKIKSLINSAALKKTQTCCRHMSFSAAEQVCLQVSCKSCRRDSDKRRRSVGRLFQMSGLETAKFLRSMECWMMMDRRLTKQHGDDVQGRLGDHIKQDMNSLGLPQKHAQYRNKRRRNILLRATGYPKSRRK